MENKYVVIKRDGVVEDASKYLSELKEDSLFRAFVEREALGQSVSVSGNSDYLVYAQKLGFSWEQNADIGFVSQDYKANLIVRLVKEYARQLVQNIGFPIYEVSGSNMFDLSHPVVEAYAKLYGDRLYHFEAGKKEVVMSYDASYPQFNLAGQYSLSHRHLPFAHFSIADCYRHEQSGECMLLHRQRRFYMPDLHPYFKDVDEAFQWFPKIERLLLNAAEEAGMQYQVVVEVSSEENWLEYRDQIMAVAKNLNRDVLVAILQDGKDRYWIVNVDYKLVDKFGQAREVACIQIDVGNAKRLNIQYQDESGKQVYPAIIHSAVPGGIERYLYMLFDDFKQRFPLWLMPSQVRLIPVNQSLVPFCEEIIERYKNSAVRMEIDDRAESVGKKVRLAHEDLVPFSVVIGERELNDPSHIQSLEEAIEKVLASAKGKPFSPMGYPVKVSQQVK
jgi:threonyl-tRNA synthetase